MRDWRFWDWVTYACLFLAALIMAADTALKTSPNIMMNLPDFFHSPWWGFAPATLVVAATTILLLRELVFSHYRASQQLKPRIPDYVVRSVPERIFVGKTITTEYLSGLYKDHTGIQADKLTKAYVGKWMRITGTLLGVNSRDPTLVQITFNRMTLSDPLISMFFDQKWADRLAMLRKGDTLTVDGQIRSIELLAIMLENCELSNAPQSPTLQAR